MFLYAFVTVWCHNYFTLHMITISSSSLFHQSLTNDELSLGDSIFHELLPSLLLLWCLDPNWQYVLFNIVYPYLFTSLYYSFIGWLQLTPVINHLTNLCRHQMHGEQIMPVSKNFELWRDCPWLGIHLISYEKEKQCLTIKHFIKLSRWWMEDEIWHYSHLQTQQ